MRLSAIWGYFDLKIIHSKFGELRQNFLRNFTKHSQVRRKSLEEENSANYAPKHSIADGYRS